MFRLEIKNSDGVVTNVAEKKTKQEIIDWYESQKQYFPKNHIKGEVIDLAPILLVEKNRNEALEYLKSTDWYVIRQMDSGVEMPEEIKQKRQEARDKYG